MRLLRSLTVVSLMLSVASCGDLIRKLKGEAADAGEEAGVADVDAGAPEPTPAAALAANEDDIVRFPDEAKLENVAATVQRTYNVREAPPAGDIVASLGKGQAVKQIASRGKYFLITWDDAKKGKKLMGWIHGDAFSAAPVDAGLVEPKCSAGEVPLISETTFCGKICSKDDDCPSGQACKGSAAKWNKGKAGDAVTVCTLFHPHDGGAPAHDAGAGGGTAQPDAGASTSDAGSDSGAKLPAAPTNTDKMDPVGGQCPAFWVLLKKDNKCHRVCPRAADCRDKFFCVNCENQRVCDDNRDFCK